MDYNVQGSRDVIAINTANGALAAFAPTGASIGNTLTAATWVLPLGSGVYAAVPGETTCLTAHLSWAAAVAGTLTVECSNYPRYWNGARSGPDDVTDYSTTAGHWPQWNIALSGANNVQVAGTGNSATAYTITLGGTNAGTALIQLADCGFRRVRLKIVASVGGLLRCCVTGKLGS
jgi:hypothetical protein